MNMLGFVTGGVKDPFYFASIIVDFFRTVFAALSRFDCATETVRSNTRRCSLQTTTELPEQHGSNKGNKQEQQNGNGMAYYLECVFFSKPLVVCVTLYLRLS